MWRSALATAALVTALLPGSTLAGGKVSGVVKFADDYPRPEKIKTTQDFEVCGLMIPDETFVVSPDSKGLKNAVITIVGAAGDPQPLAASIHQKGCAYGPRVQIARPDDEIEFVNEDPLLHNVHAYEDDATLFNMAHPKYRKVIKQKLGKAGVVEVKCDVHPWMTAYVFVTDDPFVTLTDENGRFAFDNVPAGTYTVRLWHEALGTSEKQVTVADDGTATIDFTIGE